MPLKGKDEEKESQIKTEREREREGGGGLEMKWERGEVARHLKIMSKCMTSFYCFSYLLEVVVS